ncbi:uncharacterized protein LOC133635404 [Entelurus aequoreus]|uniref:uncharacterized protein LOC133635404 n=1 Tax=Entelurus aequoreus TaxID=161455 RepID=UPI002B1E541B|nr:uncharacterized protein LOC133635404 [Entelurus aequoreus]
MFNLTVTETSAVVADLTPSTNYDCFVYTVNHAGVGRRSKVRTVTTLMQPPVGVTATQTGLDTARVTWQPVEDVLVYHVEVQNTDEPGGEATVYNVTDTRLDVDSILPCSTYTISVSSFNNFLVPSEPTVYTYTTNKLTPVSAVSVDYSCASQSVMVHWTSVFGADSYRATAMDQNGTLLTCTSQSTSCNIGGLRCDQTFKVHVTPISENCENMANSTWATFETVPCGPKNLELSHDCSSQVIIFSWEHTNNTDYYTARAVDSEGVVQECLTVDNSCYFTNTLCGRQYFFTVDSISGHCKSQTSSTVGIRTEPCIPQNLQTSADCNSNLLVSTWDLAEGALRYTVDAFGNKGNSHYNCSTLSNSCAIEGVHCGEYLTIYITAFDDKCASPRKLGPVAETVPCKPRNVTAVKECGADSITVSWAVTGSTLFYIAMAMDSDGVVHNCNTMGLTCTFLGLKCSTFYTVHVIGSNFMCNSSQSEAVTIETAACPPDNVTASLDCTANEALISWHGQPEINSYTASIVDEVDRLLSCSSTTTSCRVANLKCGQLYTVTVCHHDSICPSMPSQPIYMDSVPCGPQVDTHLDCQSQGLTIVWNASSRADSYMAAISYNNTQTFYNTTWPELSISPLECGQDYSLEVMSVTDNCVSHPSELPVWKAPCVPTNVVAMTDCGQSFVEVSWQASRGAMHYQAAATHQDGHRLLCASNETSCRLEGLRCSQVYSIAVAAGSDECFSNESLGVVVATAPCPPSQLNVSVNCSSTSAMLSWKSSPNAMSYTGKAVSTDGHTVTCAATSNPGCYLELLHCGKEYSFTVTATDGDCQSPESQPVLHETAPCTVQNVVNALDCRTNMLTISWTPAFMPVNYSASILAEDGAELKCVTETSVCTLTSLQCGQQYEVTVTAASATCEGPSSLPERISSVPCLPVNVQVAVECYSNTVLASWDAAAGAMSYISTLTAVGSYSSSCHTSDQSCQFPGLQCANTYVLSVTAQNNQCNSSESTQLSVETAPCEPASVWVSTDCMSGVATVTWERSAGAQYYTVLAQAYGHNDSCTSATDYCELGRLRCGEDYTVTVFAEDGVCTSSMHAQANLTTAPCPPVVQDHSLDCTSNHALVSWLQDANVRNVTVSATSSTGHSTSCVSTANLSCILTHLRCGNTYSAHALAQGTQCSSKSSSTFEIVAAPCPPTNVGHTYSCETGTAMLSWDETLGRNSFYAHVYSADDTLSCSSNQTDCFLPSLSCGNTYNATVMAINDQCNSSWSAVTQILTAPCAPMDVQASLLCEGNTAAVSWQHSPGAKWYNVTAQGINGDVEHCNSNDTSCHLPGMLCDQTYAIVVTPISDLCRGLGSDPYTFIAGPCPPTNVQVTLRCSSNLVHVTWDAAVQADGYEVTAVTATNGYHRCNSSDASCSLGDLGCGETAVVTVATVGKGCRSEPSLPQTFQSVICPPTSVAGVTTCANNDITVSWDPSPEDGATYTIHTEEDGGTGVTYAATQRSHVIGGLQCGQLYLLAVSAMDSECTSNLSQTIQAQTAPCPPTDLAVSAECGTNLGTLTWAPSAHAANYTATVTGAHGHVATCSTDSTACSVKLDCGYQYTATVIASSSSCDSPTGATVTFDSAPCLPDSVEAELHCSNNSFAVQWSGSVGHVTSYTAIAIGSDDTRATCNTSNTRCTIQNLKCGLFYGVVVTTPSVSCGTIKGSDYMMQSAPCEPNSVTVNLHCSTNTALVTWGNVGPDQTQVVSAVDSRGLTTVCNSSSSNCTFDQLLCGESYIISVVGHTNSCSSDVVFAQQLDTAPCMPTHVTALVDCDTGIAVVTWDGSGGAASYTAYARGNLGHNAECNTTDTNCDFPYLACGQDYTIAVVARHDTCVSVASEPVHASTGPCPHSGLETTLDCDANTVVVSWTRGSGIRYYNASADAFNVAHAETCSTNGTSCNISSLRCGESYKISVIGQGQDCPSPSQDWHRMTTAPCPPTQLRVDSSCESNDISLSWQASQGSVTYTAVAENARGQRWMCNTSSTSCSIPALQCGQSYQVYVSGVDDQCNGARSHIEEIQSAPCAPHGIQKDFDCLSGVLNVTWQSTGYAPYFHASLLSSEGDVSGCVTDGHHCVVQGTRCGLTYDVTVVAKDGACNSSHSPAEQVTTAPCPPSSFLPTVDCDTGTVRVNWTNSVAGVVYAVSAVDLSGRQHNCSATDGGCDLSTLDCGKEYNITVIPSRDGCVGRHSPSRWIQTVPCTPHLSDVEMDCPTNSAWVIGDDAAGAKDYVVLATDSLGDVQMFQCNSTSDSTCTLPPLRCSQNLTFSVKARDHQCSSQTSNLVTTYTAPCPPVVVDKSVSCDNGTISISWESVPGVVSYTATLGQVGGHTTRCATSDLSCDLSDLPCGETYVLLVTAEGRTCNSSQSAGHVVRTVPCVPQKLQASLSCHDNAASVSWNDSNGAQTYRVRATSTTGETDECSTHDTQCDLTGLSCGRLYTASVTAEDSDCQSQPSQSVTIRTVPCIPENISSVVDCDTKSLNVYWSESSGADSYIASALDSNGQTTTCHGTNGSCGITPIGCGLIYHVSVVSSDGYCSSQPTPVIDTAPVPCPPTHITAALDCYTQRTTVGWYPSDGAVSYTVKTTVPGDLTACETNTTHCDLEGMLCGQSYSIAVMAVGSICSSIAYMTGTLLTEPCTPSHISAYYSLTIGQVLWDATTGADNYTVEGVTEQGLMVSCNTNNTHCALFNMECGQIYNISVAVNNVACQGVSASTEDVLIKTEPCPPTNVQASVDCLSNVGGVSWEASFGAIGYKAHLAGHDGHSLSCYTEDTFCSIDDLHCGTVYYTTVVATGEKLNSTQSTTVHLDSAPCAVTNVATSLECHNNTVGVNWSLANGADSYMVTAVSADGHQAVCESPARQCDLTDLLCGRTYNISITSISDHCHNETVSSVTFNTRPCEPSYVGVDLQCGTSTANVHWEGSHDVGLYMAMATSSVGRSHQCNSTNSSCKFSDLDCGETYTFYVTAVSNMCRSENSSIVYIRTEPCKPTDLRAEGSCDNDTFAVHWSAAKGATGYVVTVTGDLGYVTTFQTNETMTEGALPCGQLFTFTVKAQDDRCDSSVSQPAVLKTGPCVPQHVQSYTHCEDNVGSVSWAGTDGADYYLAIAVGQDGHTHMCMTVNTSCTWDDLHCGERYTVHVIADGDTCGSMPSNSTTIQMASCIPQNVTSTVNCTTKVASLTWNPVETADYYIVTAGANSSHEVQLSTNDTWTFFHHFLCGQVDFLTVQAVDSVCTSRHSEPSVLKSEPCPPTAVSSAMNCEAEIAVISWSGSAAAEFYTATITREDGQTHSCWSESVQCGVPDIPCGENYTVTVVASNENCHSESSEESILQSAPCVPNDVDVMLDCTSNEAVVTWNATKGTLSYKVTAQSSLGTQSTCESAEPTCTLTNLTCGQFYLVQVVAEGEVCSSLPSPAARFKSVPCTPDIGSVVLDCFTGAALLDWGFAEGALNYSATATSSNGHVSTCSSNHSDCELLNLQCGQTYTVVTVASDQGCSSPPSNSLLLESVPCVPQVVSAAVACNDNTGIVSWEDGEGVSSYTVQAFGPNGHKMECNNTAPSCQLPSMHCGQLYNLTVTAQDGRCDNSRAYFNLQSAPCRPTNVSASVQCHSNAAAVAWERAGGAVSYLAVAVASDGSHRTECNDTTTYCDMSPLLCGHTYNVSVFGQDESCSAVESDMTFVQTAPCPPLDVAVESLCEEMAISVSWSANPDAQYFHAMAVSQTGQDSTATPAAQFALLTICPVERTTT